MTRLQRPIAGKIRVGAAEGSGKEDSDGNQHQSAPRSLDIRDREVLPRSEFRHQRRGQDQQQKGSLEQEQQNQGDKDGRRDDPFHDFKQDTRWRASIVSSSLS